MVCHFYLKIYAMNIHCLIRLFFLFFVISSNCQAQAYWIYMQGEEEYNGTDSIKPNYDHAFYLYKKAVEMGCPMAEYKLSVCFSLGRGVVKSDRKAFKWCRKAAEHGVPEAQYMLGYHYFIGKGCCKSSSKAYKWIFKAANRGDSDAIEFLQQFSLYPHRRYVFEDE